MKYKVGDKVEMTQIGSSRFKIGEVVEITDIYPDPPTPHYRAKSTKDGNNWWIEDDWCVGESGLPSPPNPVGERCYCGCTGPNGEFYHTCLSTPEGRAAHKAHHHPQQVGEEPFEMFKRPMPEGFRIDYISAPFLPKTRAVLLVHPDLIPPPPKL